MSGTIPTVLPPGWTRHHVDGREFYYNTETKVSSWAFPTEPPAAILAPSAFANDGSFMDQVRKMSASQKSKPADPAEEPLRTPTRDQDLEASRHMSGDKQANHEPPNDLGKRRRNVPDSSPTLESRHHKDTGGSSSGDRENNGFAKKEATETGKRRRDVPDSSSTQSQSPRLESRHHKEAGGFSSGNRESKEQPMRDSGSPSRTESKELAERGGGGSLLHQELPGWPKRKTNSERGKRFKTSSADSEKTASGYLAMVQKLESLDKDSGGSGGKWLVR